MKVLIDTNVIIDVLAKREPHFKFSFEFLEYCKKELKGFITTNQTTDIYYLLCRFNVSSQSAKEVIGKLCDNFKVLDISAIDVKNALDNKIKDYEDALITCRANRQKIDYIITRNEKDFKLSEVPALSPKAFLEKFVFSGIF